MLRRMTVFIFSLLFLTDCWSAQQTVQGPRYGNSPDKPAKPIYRLAIHPLHNPKKLAATYLPLVDFLNKHVDGVSFQLEASRDYAAYEVKIRAREAELLLPNPWQTLEAIKQGYNVIATAGDAVDFRGIFLVRKESSIKSPDDIKGKVVSYPSPTALAATILPQFYLHTHGVNVNRDIDSRYVGSQESSIMSVFLRQSDVGATWPPPWRAFQKEHPKEAAQMRVLWETQTLVNNSVMVRNDVPDHLRDRIRDLLVGLQYTEEGRMLLSGMETARFHLATDADYAPVRKFIQRFERDIRHVELKE